MKITFSGDDPELARWKSAAQNAGIEIDNAENSQVSPSDRRIAIVAGSSTFVLNFARSIGELTPLLVLPQAGSAASIAYGLLPGVEDGRIAAPAWTCRYSAAVTVFLRRFAAGDLGDLQLLHWERTESPADADQSGLMSAEQSDARFIDDIDMLRLLGGNYSRITAVPLGGNGAHWRQLSVTLAAEGLPEAVWTIAAGARQHWKLTITASRGVAVLQCTAAGPVTISINGAAIEIPITSEVETCLHRFVRAASRPETEGPATRCEDIDPIDATWNDFIRAADLLEGLRRSLRRRRTIDLQFESTSERSLFKTQMTAIGCGVLTWAFLGTCVGLVLGSALDPRDSSERRAAAAQTILYETDFSNHGIQLLAESRARIVQQTRFDGEETIVLIEQQGTSGFSDIDSDRLTAIETLLQASDDTRRAQITVKPLAGKWFRRAMLAIWIITFLPLGIFLTLQLLLAVARPTNNSDS